ncbi:hypothetical protein FIBSPDRAFT_861826 [Athelia psychrophila]|uniref:Yeast cell wall synthesis Kre9/Knh1-like N-terminal domain-containing protein n=1 Tax=Athelia psychrophila TaxID=1759441 RepID=A0A166IYI9_9AGAM|nr:hypothetical protein FIBSPDRAFT_861826 [Fibularhizoctonia sp. CBS 109695]
MQFTTTSLFALFFALFSALSLTSAAPLSLDTRDVWSPPVTYPHTGTVWKIGAKHNVTWDTSNAPKQITNKIGSIYLRDGEKWLPTVVASGFSILDGRKEITVPSVKPGSSYTLVLMGDSGNISEEFKIEA